MRILAVLMVLASATAAHAVNVTDPAQVRAGDYRLEPAHTQVLFSFGHFGFSTFYGRFNSVSGSLQLDPKQLAASQLSVSIPVDSISTGNAKLDGELRGAQFFDGAKYPTISFTARQVTVAHRSVAQVSGDLTMHGVTRPVTLVAKFNGAGINPIDKAYTVGFEVSGHVKRSDFGISQYVPMVSDDVTLIISAPFEAK